MVPELELVTTAGAGRRASAGGQAELVANLSGTILEIGPGRGVNFRYLATGTSWIGLEPDVSLHETLRRTAAAHGCAAALIAGAAEQIPLADATMDAVLSTRVLCSVRDPRRALEEIRRVLRPGGWFVFIEHVAAPRGTWLRRAQKLAAPLSRCLDNGCDPSRDTEDSIERAGFRRVEIERFTLRGPFDFPIPHIAGHAEV